jgi:hypothetical protein
MSDGLLRLVYVSTATSGVSDDGLRAILARASTRNAADGITGMLCAGRGHYLQVLEGSVRPVMALYLRISADARHRDPNLLSIALVSERLFGQWAMAYIDGSGDSALAHEVLLAERDIDARRDRAAAILRRFVEELKQSAASPLDATAVN